MVRVCFVSTRMGSRVPRCSGLQEAHKPKGLTHRASDWPALHVLPCRALTPSSASYSCPRSSAPAREAAALALL